VGAVVATGVGSAAGRASGGSCFDTKVIADAMDLFIWGERFLRSEMGRLEGPEGNEMVVRRHRIMGEEKRVRGCSGSRAGSIL